MNFHYESVLGENNTEVDRRIFSEPSVFGDEISRIFGRAWLFVGHESQIPEVGDYVQSRMGIDSVILTRDRQDEVQVLHNSCRHRGMKVCRYDEGNTKRFYCQYHAWTYGLEGELLNLPYSEIYPGFEKKNWGLKRARVASFRGFVFATWDAEAPAFEDYLGDLRQPLWEGLGPWDGGDGEVELIGGTLKWVVPCNWKMIAENFAGDPLHEPSHASVNQVRLGPDGRRDPLGELCTTYFPQGHGFVVEQFDPTEPRPFYAGSKATADYYAETFRKRTARFGKRAGTSLVLGTVFPNTAIHTSQPRTIMVANPISWDKAEMWRMFYVDKDAPVEVKSYLRRYYIAYGGPGGMTEQDDMENWNSAYLGTISDQARTMPFNYGAGIGMARMRDDISGTVSTNPMSEQNARNYYKRWVDYLIADSWSDLSV